ncbi:unnamed protein product [Lota lota]
MWSRSSPNPTTLSCDRMFDLQSCGSQDTGGRGQSSPCDWHVLVSHGDKPSPNTTGGWKPETSRKAATESAGSGAETRPGRDGSG